MIPMKDDPKYREYKASPGTENLITDLYAHIKSLIKILQVTEKQLTRGMTPTERKHTLQHITDILGSDTTLNDCKHPDSYHFHDNAPPYCPNCDSYL